MKLKPLRSNESSSTNAETKRRPSLESISFHQRTTCLYLVYTLVVDEVFEVIHQITFTTEKNSKKGECEGSAVTAIRF